MPLNESALAEFYKEVNTQATVREYLMAFTTKLLITSSNSIKLQATTLAQLTKATNQLTRTTLVELSTTYFLSKTCILLDDNIRSMLSINTSVILNQR